MAKKELVLIDGELEYILHEKITDKGLHVKLTYSNSMCWAETYRGQTALEAVDNGSGIKILTKLDKKIDYHEAIMLVIVLKKLSGSNLDIELIKYKEDAD